MYFKRLELVGFKSFAEKTRIKFEQGVTAIVGPNGCGKSNISDSIKWVLGEQSVKELRGSRMEDVIFNGTSSKEPINMAEVSLVLSNENKILPIDYDEIIITRRLFRSGESEYFINKIPVRLKDINDLFAGTGIGTSSYSIIEQGQIGLILSSKPEERRYIFEEASGITKFKMKKKEALRKLEHTENNLLRINDIITEVEKQIKSIERQAKKAERYKSEFESLKELDLEFSCFKYRNTNNELKAITMERRDFKIKEEEVLKIHSILSEDARLSKEAMQKVNEDIQKIQMEITELRSCADKNSYTVRINLERMEELAHLAENLKKEVGILNGKLNKRKIDLENFKNELMSIDAVKKDKERIIEEDENQIKAILKDIELFSHSVKEAKEKTVDLLALETKNKNELMKLGMEVQNKKTRSRRLKIEKENITKEKESLEIKLKDACDRMNWKDSELLAEKNNLSNFKIEIEHLENSIRTRENDIFNLKKAEESTRSRLGLLKEMDLKNEGFQKSVLAIKEEDHNILSVVDIIMSESGFENAVESVLGEFTQGLIVNEREEALRFIEFIKNRNLGRALFIINKDLGLVKPRTPKFISNDCTPITNFIKYSSKFEDIIFYLFKDAYLTNSYEDADRLYDEFHEYRFVTKDGYLKEGPKVMGGAVITAGASIIGRKENMQEMESQVYDTVRKIQIEIGKNKEDENKLTAFKEKYGHLESLLRNKESEHNSINVEIITILNEIKRANEEDAVINAELEDVSSTLDEIVKQGEELNLSLNKQESEYGAMQDEIASYENKIKEKSILKEESILKTANLKGEFAGIKISYDNICSNLEMRQSEYTDIKIDIESKNNQIRQSIEKNRYLSEENIALLEEKKILEEKMVEFKAELENLNERANAVMEQFSQKEAQLKEKENELEFIRNNIRDLEVKMSEINYRKMSLVERIKQAYETDISNFNIEIDENTDWEDVKKRIEESKERLQGLGQVNLVAIEEHKELEERYQFLTKQREDLINAKESIHKVIVKINATTRQMFSDTFQKVQVEFRNYFRMLFGGGHAEVYLLDERDILESGIEIVARPPGKKLQNIMLLSGGEKSLTAIALLFAIFKVHPSPFCILDEIDAALDESNIDRFIRVLQEFVRMSQFILITHSKKTIQMADILYGITMAEKGISKIVSVRLTDHKEAGDREEVMV